MILKEEMDRLSLGLVSLNKLKTHVTLRKGHIT